MKILIYHFSGNLVDFDRLLVLDKDDMKDLIGSVGPRSRLKEIIEQYQVSIIRYWTRGLR